MSTRNEEIKSKDSRMLKSIPTSFYDKRSVESDNVGENKADAHEREENLMRRSGK